MGNTAPGQQDIDRFVSSLQKEVHAVRSFEQMVNELAALPPTVIIRDDVAPEPTSQGGPVDMLRGTESSVAGIHSALRDVETILGALEYGERIATHDIARREIS